MLLRKQIMLAELVGLAFSCSSFGSIEGIVENCTETLKQKGGKVEYCLGLEDLLRNHKCTKTEQPTDREDACLVSLDLLDKGTCRKDSDRTKKLCEKVAKGYEFPERCETKASHRTEGESIKVSADCEF